MRSLLPAPTPRRRARAAPAGHSWPALGGQRRAPHREEAEQLLRPRSRLPAHGAAEAPRPSPALGLGGSRRGFGNERLAAGCPLWSASIPPLFRPPRRPVTIPVPAPAPRSKEHMFPLEFLARLTTSHGQGKAAPRTKAESEIWNVNARGRSDGGCRKKRSISPFSVLRRRFSVNCRYHNASLLSVQVSRGDSLHSLTCHS